MIIYEFKLIQSWLMKECSRSLSIDNGISGACFDDVLPSASLQQFDLQIKF